MPIALVQSGGATANNPTVTLPSAPTPGNLLITTFVATNNGGSASAVYNAFSGWTTVRTNVAAKADGAFKSAMYYRPVQPGDPAAWTSPGMSQAVGHRFFLSEWAGTLNLLNASAEGSPGTGNPVPSGTLMPTPGNDGLLYAVFCATAGGSMTPPIGWTEVDDSVVGFSDAAVAYFLALPTIGSYTPTAVHSAGASDRNGISAAFLAAATAPPSGDGDPGAWLGDYMRIE